MKKLIAIILIGVIVIFVGLKIDSIMKAKTEVSEKNTPQATSTQQDSSTSEDLSDDAVFADGSIPTTWDVAGITDPIGFKKFLLALRSSVLAHDTNAVVATLQTPKYTQQYAREHYSTLFNQKVVNAFQNLNIHEIFRNYQGAMIGDGTVWFQQNSDGTFSISAINNS
jgi:hypothetical protein